MARRSRWACRIAQAALTGGVRKLVRRWFWSVFGHLGGGEKERVPRGREIRHESGTYLSMLLSSATTAAIKCTYM